MTEVQEVMAEPIDEAIEPMSGLDVLVSDITDEAQRLAAEYQPREITSEEDFKQSKRERTGARKDIAALKQRYTDAMRAIKDAVSEADARAKAALSPLDAIQAEYKRENDAYLDRWRLERCAVIAEEYQDFAPDLVPLVPFDRLLRRFGQEKGKQWDARSLSEAQAIAAMQKAVETIAQDERAIDAYECDDDEKTYMKADYFETLDLSYAFRRMQERKAQRDRVEMLERERRQRDEDSEGLQSGKPIIDTHSSMTPEEYAQACADTGTPLSSHAEQRSRLIRDVATTAAAPAPGERVPSHVFAGYGNVAQAEAFAAWCDRAGVSRRVVILTHGNSYKLTTKG